MKMAIVLHFDVPDADPESVVRVLSAINPPSLPHFDGTANVVVPPHVQELAAWLDEE